MKQLIVYFSLLIGSFFVYQVHPVSATDSDWLAFTCVPADQNSTEIYKMRSDGTNLLQLTHNRFAESLPAWSPNGEQIAFVSAQWVQLSNILIDSVVYRMDADGNNVDRVPNFSLPSINPVWSPDGEWIAFVSGDTTPELYKMRVDGSEVTSLTLGLYVSGLAWSPDGEWIAFVSHNNTLYRIRPDGSDLELVTTTDRYIFSPAWSPDGEWIMFLGDLTKIYRIKGEGTEKQILVESDHIRAAAWSPSGTFIAYSVFDGEEDKLFYIAADGNDRQLVYSAISSIVDPVWSRDEQQIFFAYGGSLGNGEFQSLQLYRIDIEGNDLIKLTDLPCNIWDLSIFSN